MEASELEGRHVRLEPLELRHADGLAAASAVEPSLYQWSPVPQGKLEATKYIETALAWREAGTALAFATIRVGDGIVIGSTRFFDILMLTHAFETWKVHRVCLHTDVRNQRSRNAIERMGGRFEGILRAHRMAADFIPRDSARYSIIASEWPAAKQQLIAKLER